MDFPFYVGYVDDCRSTLNHDIKRMSTNLQEIDLGMPDLSGFGIEPAYSAVAWAMLDGHSFNRAVELMTQCTNQLNIKRNDAKLRLALRLLTPVYVQTEGIALAISTLAEIAGDRNASPAARVTAAKEMIDYERSEVIRGSSDGKSPEEMTIDELQTAIDSLEHEAANRARDITPGKEIDSADLARDNSQLFDLLE